MIKWTHKRNISVFGHTLNAAVKEAWAPGHKMEKYLDDFKVSRFRCN